MSEYTPPASNQPVALVTGASSGFGMLTSLLLAAEGYRVAAGLRDLSRRTELAARAEAQGLSDRIDIVELDVTDETAAIACAKDIAARYGRIDLLVNNAGFALGGFTEDIPLAEWRRQMETNFFGVLNVTRAVLPYMRARNTGRIINVSSVSGLLAFPGYAPYSASKYALEGFSEALRLELLPYGIKVALVEPGSYKTAIWQKGFDAINTSADSPYASRLHKVLRFSRQASEQAADPMDVAKLIVRVAAMRNPKLRYPIGRDARLTLLGKALLPWRWYERIVSRALQ